MILQKLMSEKNLVLQLWPKMLSANQMALSVDQLIDLLHFLHGNSYKRKLTSDTTFVDMVELVTSLVQSKCRVL